MRVDKATINEFVDLAKQATVSETAALRILSCLDLTQLDVFNDPNKLDRFCQQAQTPFGAVAAICILPEYVADAVKLLADTPIKTATVANFPTGTEDMGKVLSDIRQATKHGASEIDVVMPYQTYLSGNQGQLTEFVRACRIACGPDVILKVIMETGAFDDLVQIAAASDDILSAGADFLKTSTGKISSGASLEAVATMLLTLKLAQNEHRRQFGLKVSGGVRDLLSAVRYLKLAEIIMGEHWLTAAHFRIGSSHLLIDILNQLSSSPVVNSYHG